MNEGFLFRNVVVLNTYKIYIYDFFRILKVFLVTMTFPPTFPLKVVQCSTYNIICMLQWRGKYRVYHQSHDVSTTICNSEALSYNV